MSLTSFIESLNDFSRNQLIPALIQSSKHIYTFNKMHVAPALTIATSTAIRFGKQTLFPLVISGPTILNATATATGKETVALSNEHLSFLGSLFRLPAIMMQGIGGHSFVSIVWNETGKWIAMNPGQSVLFLASALTCFAPGLLSAPILWGLGFGGNGVVAGSAAASMQAAAGAGGLKAGGVFATVQSAAMGGYGSAVVGSVVRVSSVGFGMAGTVLRSLVFGSNSIEREGGKVQSDEVWDGEKSVGDSGFAEGKLEDGVASLTRQKGEGGIREDYRILV